MFIQFNTNWNQHLGSHFKKYVHKKKMLVSIEEDHTQFDAVTSDSFTSSFHLFQFLR